MHTNNMSVMQPVVQNVDTQGNANEYQRILNDTLNRGSREKIHYVPCHKSSLSLAVASSTA
jgi:hypothetical protein